MNAIWITLCCAAIVLAGCKANSAPLDPYLVGTANCSPPCWNSILPGQTSQDTAVLMMRQLNDENGGDLSIHEYDLSWREKVSGRFYGVYFQDNLVKLIEFRTDRTSLEQVIDLFGNPDYWATWSVDSGGPFIFIYYPDKGLAFTINPGNQKIITKDVPVSYSFFVSSTDIQNEIRILHGERLINKVMAKIHEWKGYGDVISQN